MGETLDLSVGFTDIAHIGDVVDNQTPLAVIHASTTEQANVAAQMIQHACEVSATHGGEHTVIYDILTAE